MMDLSKILDTLRLSPRVLFGVALASGTMLMASDRVLSGLGLRELLETHRGWVGGALVVSAALFAAHGMSKVASKLQAWFSERRRMQGLREQLWRLSPPEKAVLLEYTVNGTTTRYFEIADGVVNGLVGKKILYRASNVSAGFTSFPFNLQPWAWVELQLNPALLTADLDGDNLTGE